MERRTQSAAADEQPAAGHEQPEPVHPVPAVAPASEPGRFRRGCTWVAGASGQLWRATLGQALAWIWPRLVRPWAGRIPWLWRLTLGRIRHKFWIVTALLYVFVWHTTGATFVLLFGNLLMIRAQSAVYAKADAGHISRRREVLIAALITMLTVGTTTILEEAIRPGPLPRATLTLANGSTVNGAFIAETTSGVYIGSKGR